MTKRHARIALWAIALSVIAITSLPARAGVDVSFGAAVPIGDDGNLFVSISSRYFDREPQVIAEYGRRYFADPDDLAVGLYLSRYCDRGMDFFFSLRRQGLGWFEISNRCAVPMDVWFVPVRHDPGPPYGRAYGHWRKHQRDPEAKVLLTDADMRNLVAVRMASEYYGVSPETAMRWRRDGGNVRNVMVRQYHQRHPNDHQQMRAAGGHGGDKGHGRPSPSHHEEKDRGQGPGPRHEKK